MIVRSFPGVSSRRMVHTNQEDDQDIFSLIDMLWKLFRRTVRQIRNIFLQIFVVTENIWRMVNYINVYMLQN